MEVDAQLIATISSLLEHLQLPDIPPSALSKNSSLLHHLYLQWLSLPDSAKLVRVLIDNAKEAGTPVPGNASGSPKTGGSAVPGLAGGTPPLSPRSPRFGRRISSLGKSSLGSVSSPLRVPKEPPAKEAIPQFYFLNGRPPSDELKQHCLTAIGELFVGHPDGLQMQDFKVVTKEICRLPSFFSTVLFKKIDEECTGTVTRESFVEFWVNRNMISMDKETLIFSILKKPDHNYLTPEDFRPVLGELLASHPGLEFLQSTPEFQDRYADTVIYRIFYTLSRSGNGQLSLRELKRGNLIEAMEHADEEDDINKVLRYFSYEHFYVIYCKFWELDNDHDFLIDKGNLVKYGNRALTYRIIDRIFSQAPRRFCSKTEGKMCYEDFVYFILSEEDKTSEPSLEYWFKCVDFDGNGIITHNEVQFFYEEQLHRIECMGQERVLFEDILCQIIDMIKPENDAYFTLRDFKQCKLSGHVFNILFNLNKFMGLESRDPFLIRQMREEPHLTEWDRFARREYIRLSMEEDCEDASNGSDVYDESNEIAF